MQAHMMRTMPQMAPSPDQQRNIQLQMLTHMKRELASDPDLVARVAELEQQLIANTVTPIETNLAMRQLQQELMRRRMEKVIKQTQPVQQQQQQKGKEEEEVPMTGSVNDEDL